MPLSARTKRKGPENTNAEQRTTDVAPVKRQRVSRACDQCRTAREKCDGIDPCFACASQNRQCSYSSNPKRRGIQPGYIRTLELALAWTFHKIPGSEAALNSMLAQESAPGQSLFIGKDTVESKRLHKRWRKSGFHRDVDRILSGNDGFPSGSDKLSPPDDDSDSDEEATKEEQSKNPIDPLSTLTPASLNGEPILDTVPPYSTTTRPQHAAFVPSSHRSSHLGVASERTLHLPPNHWRLLDVYFAYTHCWFPIIEKHDLLKISYTYPDSGLVVSLDAPGSAAHAELWAVLALAAFQDAGSLAGGYAEQVECPSPQAIYDIARSLIPREEGHHEIGNVKALLLLALVNIGKNSLKSAWIMTGKATRIAYTLGLGADGGTNSPRKTHVFLACFVLDTLVSAQLGQNPYIKVGDIDLTNSLGEDGLEEWQPWTSCAGFGSYAQSQFRSPLRSLSTFNQITKIHEIFNQTSAARGFLSHTYVPEDQENLLTSLRQSINSQSASSPFVLTGKDDGGTIPSAFLLRLLYLVALTTLGVTCPETTASSILDLIEQFVSKHGLCGAPSIFLSCIDLAHKRIPPDVLTDEVVDRWNTVEASLRSIWVRSDEPQAHGAPQTAVKARQRSTATNNSDSFIPQNMVATNHTEPRRSSSQATTYLPPTTNRAGPFSHRPPTTATAATNLPEPPLAPLPPSVPFLPSHHNRMAFDYDDALLNDFAFLDTTDHVGTDTKFMENLGFAPGSDLSDVLGPDFASYERSFGSFV